MSRGILSLNVNIFFNRMLDTKATLNLVCGAVLLKIATNSFRMFIDILPRKGSVTQTSLLLSFSTSTCWERIFFKKARTDLSMTASGYPLVRRISFYIESS